MHISHQHVEEAIALAKTLNNSLKTSKKDAFSKRMGPIIDKPSAKTFLIKLMDTSFRSYKVNRIATYIKKLLVKNRENSIIFNRFERMLLNVFEKIGVLLPWVSIPLMLKQIQQSTQSVVFFTGSKRFDRHAKNRKTQDITLNINLIGEALIGEAEANVRIEKYIALLRQPNVDYISIKISTIYSQLTALAFDDCIEELVKRLGIFYREIQEIEKKTGQVKFINLDMEEYRDLRMTVVAFKKTLSRSEFTNLRAGIVLQAYLPDSYDVLLDLQQWAKERVASGGSPIKVRLVKGANLEMEQTESAMEHWELVTYRSKIDTDANYKRMMVQMLQKEFAPALNAGIASHNIFDLSLAMTLSKAQGVSEFMDIEMLEGMANELVNVLMRKGISLLLYTPIVNHEGYNSAIAYLVRRLDEGTQEGNFLKEGFNLKTDGKQWTFLEGQFLEGINRMATCRTAPYRQQDRNKQATTIQTDFHNVANTDWVLPQNLEWIESIKKRWQRPTEITGEVIPVVAANLSKDKRENIRVKAWQKLPWSYELANEEDYNNVIAQTSPWQSYSIQERAMLMRKAAVIMEERRGDLIAVAVTELGKTIAEVDVEVSEAVDFANFYAQNIIDLEKEGYEYHTKGIHLVLSPWNFPIAIPIGGVLASLAAGKRVILKPSTNAGASAYLTAKCLWDAGIPKSAFAFLPAQESSLDPFLTKPDIFDAVILTGSTDTAKFLLNRCHNLNLYAETGGKNATIVTALADREQAIMNVVWSAFGNAGQKCSATSLLILEKEIFENQEFKELLKDATQSKQWGQPWEFSTFMGPLAVPANEALKKVIAETPEEQWLLKPIVKDDFFISPGIIWGITEGDEIYQKELFAPILSVIRADDLDDAIRLANGTPFGLTSGIESLDQDEISHWKARIKAGNIYANRSTTGAIVLRQPFGGMKSSCFGFGMKAGGPNYVAQFMDFIEEDKELTMIEKDYQESHQSLFAKSVDHVKIRGQHNDNVYLKPATVWVLIDEETDKNELEKVTIALKTLDIQPTYYSLRAYGNIKVNILNDWDDLIEQLDYETCIRVLNYKRLSKLFLKACHEKAVHLYRRKPSNNGRMELLNYLTEQSQSINYHRYGNLMGTVIDQSDVAL